jgi:hypothetical protein
MTYQQLVSLLRVAETALWDLGQKDDNALRAQQEIARALRAVDSAANCAQCGKPLAQQGSGRPKTYCGATCRSAAYRERQAG